MTQEAILLVGAGGHARSCIDVIETEGRFIVAGLVGLPHEVGRSILGYPIMCADSDLPKMAQQYKFALVAVGQIKSPDLRIQLFSLLERSGFVLPAIVSPRAYVSVNATLLEGTIVMPGAVINAGATVGRNCIVNSQALIEHDATIDDHCHISTAVAINSGVRIGAATFIGSNTAVRQSLCIGKRCVIGMGQRVIANVADEVWLPSKKVAS